MNVKLEYLIVKQMPIASTPLDLISAFVILAILAIARLVKVYTRTNIARSLLN